MFVNKKVESLVLMAAEDDGTPMVINLPMNFLST
jgi:hypothetical protein